MNGLAADLKQLNETIASWLSNSFKIPSEIPARVDTLLGSGKTGFIKPTIVLSYPNGLLIDDLYFRTKIDNYIKPNDLVIATWEKSPEEQRAKKNNSQLIQARTIRKATDAEIKELEAHILSSQNKVKVLEDIQQRLQEEIEKIPSIIQILLQERLTEIENRSAKLDRLIQNTQEEINAGIAKGVEVEKFRIEKELNKLEVEKQKLLHKENILLQQDTEVRSKWSVLVDERSKFEREGGPVFIEYLRTLDDQDHIRISSIEHTNANFDLKGAKEQLKGQGYQIDENLLRQSIVATFTAWKTGQFIVLVGATGTGKTQLVRQLSSLIGAGAGLVSVRPGWVEPTDLFGYYNPVRRLYEPTVALDYLRIAQSYAEQDRFYFFCLDEMNLSRIENYASDLLGRLERRGSNERVFVDIYSQDIARSLSNELEYLDGQQTLSANENSFRRTIREHLVKYPPRLPLATGIVAFGTVNMDETTFMLSPKFLDRSLVLRVPPTTSVDWDMLTSPFLTKETDGWSKTISGISEDLEHFSLSEDDIKSSQVFLEKWLSPLQGIGVNFGYRFYKTYNVFIRVGNMLGFNILDLRLDFFLQKVLPRIRFSLEENQKMDILKDWLSKIDKDKKAKPHRVIDAVTAMLEHGEQYGMVEYWID